ncbi:MAG: 30S ribosomal protein S6 [Kiritimatiellaeota bacterium]|nr:30S ribosomal protein S6 [Kiritimatiellota bacterium]
MKKYETIVILDERKIKDDGKEFLAEIEKLITGEFGGKIVKSVVMGKKQFARAIKKRKTGVYLSIVHEMETDKIALLKDKYKLKETVLRMQSYNYDRPE